MTNFTPHFGKSTMGRYQSKNMEVEIKIIGFESFFNLKFLDLFKTSFSKVPKVKTCENRLSTFL